MTDLLSSNLTGLCEDVNLFSDLFTIPADMNLTMNDLHDTVCGVNINITKLVVELEKSMPGFKRFLNAVSMVLHMSWVLKRSVSIRGFFWSPKMHVCS